MAKIINAEFVTIDPERKIIFPFDGKDKLKYYYGSTFTLADVKITICENGVLEVKAKQAVYISDYNDYDSFLILSQNANTLKIGKST